MKYLVNSREMRQYDRNTTETFETPSLLLMERAALTAYEEIKRHATLKTSILVVCGVGNNGGDGLAMARMLLLEGYKVEIVLLGDEAKATEQSRIQLAILRSYGFSILTEISKGKEYGMVVDAIFGVGLTRIIEGIYQKAIEEMNALDAYKVAIDIPSGVSADNGAILGVAFKADLTITFAFDKVGMHLWPGNEMVGRIVVKEIGITERSFLEEEPQVRAVEEADLEPFLQRPSHSNKGTFGKLLIIAGSANMAGAAILAGRSAYGSGSGLVRILTPEENRVIMQTALPEAILTTYSSKEVDNEYLKDAMDWADVILCGPGIGTSEVAESMVKNVITYATVPVVFDADALNILAKDTELLRKAQTELVITPHLGEMSRLTKENVKAIQSNLLEFAFDFSKKYHLTCVLKDERTVTAMPDGNAFLNLSGNAGMATAGSGDVLAGMISSFLAQGMNKDSAVPLAVYLHGLAGDKMVFEVGKAGLMASDLVTGIRRIVGCKEGKDII